MLTHCSPLSDDWAMTILDKKGYNYNESVFFDRESAGIKIKKGFPKGPSILEAFPMLGQLKRQEFVHRRW